QCVSGSALTCSDGVACTNDSCDPATGCVFAPNNAACNDSVSCTTDTCTATGCNFAPQNSACDDSNPCTVNTCNPTGGCQSNNVMAMTPCTNGGDAGLCDGSGACVVECTTDGECSNNDVCDGVETCDANGQCANG